MQTCHGQRPDLFLSLALSVLRKVIACTMLIWCDSYTRAAQMRLLPDAAAALPKQLPQANTYRLSLLMHIYCSLFAVLQVSHLQEI